MELKVRLKHTEAGALQKKDKTKPEGPENKEKKTSRKEDVITQHGNPKNKIYSHFDTEQM